MDMTTEQKVIYLINQIRPQLQEDGGDIEFVEFTKEGIVKVELQGACGSCPHSRMTLKHGVEDVLKQNIPEVIAVYDINLGF